MGVFEDYFTAIADDQTEEQTEAKATELRAICATTLGQGRRENPPM